jgi:hypothetical protein
MSSVRVAVVGLCCPVLLLAAVRAHPADLRGSRHVAVAVCDLEAVPTGLMRFAQQVAEEVYREIGIDIDWMDAECHPGERMLLLRIASHGAADPTLSDRTLGFAEAGATSATVLYDRVNAYARHYRVKRAVLLGYVMAHELGHLLLPPNSHSIAGIMRATIDLERASARDLRFTPAQAAAVVRNVAAISGYTVAARLQNCCDARRAPSDIAASLPQTTSGSTAAWPTHVP